jgi:DNA-binding NtrC family response regulator
MKASRNTTRRQKTAKVLVVDDGPEHLLAFKAVLQRVGYHVVTAEGYHEGHAALRDGRFDLLISDLSLNDQKGQGLQLAEEAKRGQQAPSVLLLGSPQGLKNAARPLRKCVDSYLSKPVSLKRLLSGVARSLRRRPQAARASA